MSKEIKTLSQTLVKGIDFYSEEYIKQLLQETYPNKRFQTMNAVNFNRSVEILPNTYGVFSDESVSNQRLFNSQQGTVFIGKVSLALDFKAMGYKSISDYVFVPFVKLDFIEPFGANPFSIRKLSKFMAGEPDSATPDGVITQLSDILNISDSSLTVFNGDLIFSDVEHYYGYLTTDYNASGTGWSEQPASGVMNAYMKYDLQFTGFRAVLQ